MKNSTLFKFIITITILFIGTQTFGQSTFKEGYVINDDGSRKDGFIMSYGLTLPSTLYFKENLNDELIVEIETADINELNLPDIKYLKKDINIEFLDKNYLAKNENNSKDFNLEPYKVLLKVLLEFNDNRLYSYKDDQNNQYFFIETNNRIELLKYKEIIENSNKIKVWGFRQQLLEKFPIEDPKNQGIIGGIQYKEKDILKYLEKYTQQNNYSFNQFEFFNNRDFKDAINIIPKIGYYSLSHTTNTRNGNLETSFDESQFSLGIELEYFLNTVLKRSSILISYVYHSKIENEGQFSFGTTNDGEFSNSVSISTIHLKYRHYFRLFKNQYLFANAGILAHSSNGMTEYVFPETNAIIADLEYNTENNNFAFSFGLGYDLKNLQLELNYIPKMKGSYDSFSNNATSDSWEFEHKIFSISIGYVVF